MGEIVRSSHPYRLRGTDHTQDLDKEDEVPLKQVEYHQLEPYHLKELEVKKQHEEAKAQYLYENKGFSREGGEGDGY